MRRFRKLLGMIFIFGVVFFIICDEKGYKIGFENNQIIFNKTEKKSDLVKIQPNPNAVYRNSDLIHLNYEFENPKTLRKSDGMDPKYLARLEQEKNLEKDSVNDEDAEKIYTGFSIVGLGGDDTISSMFQGTNDNNELAEDDYLENDKGKEKGKDDLTFFDIEENKDNKVLYKNSHKIKIYSGFENPIIMRKGIGIEEIIGNSESDDNNEGILSGENSFESVTNNAGRKITDKLGVLEAISGKIIDDTVAVSENKSGAKYNIERYEEKTHSINIIQAARVENNIQNTDMKETHFNKTGVNYAGDNEILQKETLIKINKYQLKKHEFNLKKGVIIVNTFNIHEEKLTEIGLTDPMLQKLLENEDIDFDTLESENDEFLQKVFEKTKDIEVMNLIVETYLNEYQFVKAKKFIENLSEEYLDNLKPSLNLRVAFNSFPLGSSAIYQNLEGLIQDYSSGNKISEEDKNRYLGVLALMNQNYDDFFKIANNLGTERNKTFALKIQGYKDQIDKQMGMPEYYFDTLVSLELFNQGLFQPAKVLALYSLQQNVNYILPYQVLAYANFLTNSRDTSIEYLKKLVELDSNNSEKYRFLMGVASYRNEKYEQSVVMLSMIKDEKLRLDAQRYLINNYLKLDQKNKLIVSWNKLLGSDNLVASDFYTYFYETFFRPYSEGKEFQLYAYDTELANKMLRACSTTLQDEEKVVCTFGGIGRNIALGQFEGIEDYLLNLVSEYPQGYLYQALGDYYIQQGNLEKAKLYLLKAVSLTQNKSKRSQIKKLLQDTM